jgi:prophage regulatory protein
MNDKSFRLLRLPEVKKQTGLGRSTIYGEIAAENFPRPVKISSRSVAWIEFEVADWIARKIAEHRAYPKSHHVSVNQTKPDPKANRRQSLALATNKAMKSPASEEAEKPHGVNVG